MLSKRTQTSFMENVGAKIISVVIACVLWVVVLGSRSTEVTKEIPIEIKTPEGLVISDELPSKISFKIAGPKAFLRAILDRPEDPIRINLSSAKAGYVSYRFFSDNIKLPIGVKVLNIVPESLTIKLEALKKKEIPVRLDLYGQTPEGYQLKKYTVTPTHVKVKGPESKIHLIHEASTQPIDLSLIKENSEFPVQLDLVRYSISLDGPTPVASFEVSAVEPNFKMKNIPLRIKTKYKHTPNKMTVTLFVRVDAELISQIDQTSIFAEIDLSQKPKGVYSEPVQVHLPHYTHLVRVEPSTVKVTLY